MREYIKPETEIIVSDMLVMASGVSELHNEVGSDEFTRRVQTIWPANLDY